MEMSSPLAAMHPPPMPGPWGYRRDLPTAKPLFGAHTLGPKSFNFRDMSMHSITHLTKGSSDYFNRRHTRPGSGSSPTTSLAADMSSNLHMDQSPQLATPRRSLFTTNLLQQYDAKGLTTPQVRWEGVTTPPIPSSSPSFVPDSMDISPLPHKPPFGFLHNHNHNPLPLPSPSPEVNPSTDDDMMSSCDELPTPLPYPTPALDHPRPLSAADRRRPNLLRPCLSRTKNNATNTVSWKSYENNSPFKFGNGAYMNSSSLSLDECFTVSPPQERRPPSHGSLFASKNKASSLASSSLSRANGSPLAAAAVRKPVGPSSRRPSKFRRSLSMFEHPGDVMNAKQDQDCIPPNSIQPSGPQPSGLQAVMGMDEIPALKLPHFTTNEPESLPRITRETLIEVLDGVYDDLYDNKVIIDCRFEYEYNGGHIEGALNFCDKEKLAELLFESPSNVKNTLLVLHCEYSAHRAPLMAKFVRSQDRKENAHQYPLLFFPEVYILDGGYSSFYHAHSTRCYPQNYLRMDAKEHEQSCERGLNKLKQRAKLSRAQTFAFGQHSCQMEDSPTALGRTKSGGNIFSLSGDDCHPGRIGATRRMASY